MNVERIEAADDRPMARVARLLGCTEGQAYTILLGTLLAVVAALVGVPPTLRDRDPVSNIAGSVESDIASAPAPPPNSDTPLPAATASPAGARRPQVAAPTPGGAAPFEPPTSAPPPSSPTTPSSPPPVPPERFGAARVAARVGEPGAPDGVAVDEDGRLYVATNNGLLRGGSGPSKVVRYRSDGKVDRGIAVQGQEEARSSGLTGLAVLGDGTVLALDTAPARVLRLDLDRGRQEEIAAVPDLPSCGVEEGGACEAGSDGRPQPRAIAVRGDGVAFVSDSGQGVLWRLTASGGISVWYVFPEGAAAEGPTGVALDEAGDLLVVTAVSLEAAPGAGMVERIDVRPNGTAGERSAIATTDRLSGPVGIAVTAGGGIVVAATGSDELLLLGPDGAERARLTAEQMEARAGVPLDGPTGVAVRNGSLLVSNQSPTMNDASRWVVFDVLLVA